MCYMQSTFANDTIKSKKFRNDFFISYSPSIVQEKTLFHGVELTYSRKFSNWVALQFTQGYYMHKKVKGAWFNFDQQNNIKYFNAERLKVQMLIINTIKIILTKVCQVE